MAGGHQHEDDLLNLPGVPLHSGSRGSGRRGEVRRVAETFRRSEHFRAESCLATFRPRLQPTAEGRPRDKVLRPGKRGCRDHNHVHGTAAAQE